MGRAVYYPLRERAPIPLNRRIFLVAAVGPFLLPVAAARAAGSPATIRQAVKELLPPDLEGVLKDELPAAIRKLPALVMATDATAGEPYAWIDRQSGIRGVVVDLADAVGYLLGMQVRTENVPFDDLIPGLQSGRFNFSITDMLDTKKRGEVVDFVDYLVSGSSFLVATDSKLQDLDLDKLCGLSVAVLRGSVEEGYVTKQTGKCKANGKSPIHIEVYQGNNELLLAVVSGRADVMMGPRAQLSYVQNLSLGKVRSGGKPIGEATDGIAIPKGSGLTKPMQAALQKLIDIGVYRKILALYGMESNGVSKATINHARF